jgi:hypothetical protein
MVLRNWDNLRSLHINGDVVGFCSDTLGDALVSGTLRHLVTLEARPKQYVDPAFLDSDVYGWCTPLLETLSVKLSEPWADVMQVEERKFFVNLPQLRRLFVEFQEEYCSRAIMESIPLSVTDLTLMLSAEQMNGLPCVPQPGLERLAFDTFPIGSIVFIDLHLQYRHVFWGSVEVLIIRISQQTSPYRGV